MIAQRAELLFVAGPQQGERSVLASVRVLVGRNPTCDVHVTEDTVSREQVRFELTREGWVVENLSQTPIRVNGKTFKRRKGRRVLLATGDVLAMGQRTEALFVNAGDDPEQALAAYRQDHPLPEAAPPLGEPAIASHGPSASPTPAKAGPFAPVDVTANDLRRARRAKIRRYAIGFGVYALAIVGAVIGLSLLKGRGAGAPDRQTVPTLTEEEIEDALTRPVKVDVTKHPADAGRFLRKALECYEHQSNQVGDLYRAVKYFKLHQAFRQKPGFDDNDHAIMFQEAQKELIEQVRTAYADAWVYEGRKDFPRALRQYKRILQMLPVKEGRYGEQDNVVFRNVMSRITVVSKRTKTKRR